MKTTNKTYSWEELKDFILSQKDNRKINYLGTNGSDKIGNLLVQFGRKWLKKKINRVGYSTIIVNENGYFSCNAVDSLRVTHFMLKIDYRKFNTYGKVKQIIHQH